MADPSTDTNRDQFDDSRMSFGDHLEELRKRLIYAIGGLVIATMVCLKFGDHIIAVLTAPYVVAMQDAGFPPHLVQLNPTESFIEYFKICMQFGLVIAAPWALYQIWQFIAVGLYPHERKLISRFAPISIGLFVVGASFMITVVLVGLMKFLIGVSSWFPMPSTSDNWLFELLRTRPPTSTAPAELPPAPQIAVVDRDPESAVHGQAWFNRQSRELSIVADGQRYSVSLQPASGRQFVTPLFSISEYLGFVTDLALAFGLGFQIPIVVVFLIAVRILTSTQLSSARKYIVLGVFVLSAILTPTPDISTMLLLAVPMIALFEVGLLIGKAIERNQTA